MLIACDGSGGLGESHSFSCLISSGNVVLDVAVVVCVRLSDAAVDFGIVVADVDDDVVVDVDIVEDAADVDVFVESKFLLVSLMTLDALLLLILLLTAEPSPLFFALLFVLHNDLLSVILVTLVADGVLSLFVSPVFDKPLAQLFPLLPLLLLLATLDNAICAPLLLPPALVLVAWVSCCVGVMAAAVVTLPSSDWIDDDEPLGHIDGLSAFVFSSVSD